MQSIILYFKYLSKQILNSIEYLVALIPFANRAYESSIISLKRFTCNGNVLRAMENVKATTM